jgi:O-antigen/teichoic acid export membrane protein
MTAALPAAEPRRSLIGNTLWNVAGTFLPLLVGLVAVPFLLRSLGIERFGMLSLIWMLTGYFGLLDLGLGRALTKLVAEESEHVQRDELSRLIWTGLALMSAFGTAGAVVLALGAEPFVRRLLHVPEALETEAIGATWFLALSLPVTVVSTGLRGVLEGLHLFKLVNLIRLPLGILTFLAPLAVTAFTPDLAAVSASLLGVRLLALATHAIACVRTLPALARATRPDRALCRRLLGFGGWLTASNVVSPLMTYLDRFVIGSLLSLAAVAYYATPYEFVTKLWYVPFALTGVLFPAFSSSIAHHRDESAVLMVRSIAAVFVILFPAVIFAVAFAREGLGLWLGEDFASHSFRVLQWLAAGVLINSMALVCITFVLGAGRSDWVAKLHLSELPLYLFGLWWMLGVAGIVGAAIAWTIRVTVDALLLLWMAHRAAPAGIRLPGQLVLVIVIGLRSCCRRRWLTAPWSAG